MKTKIQTIKTIIKISIATFIFILFIVLGFFVKNTHTFENSGMNKWLNLTNQQQITTLKNVIHDIEITDLMMACMAKIANLPDSKDMVIRDAAVLCYNGIKLTNDNDKED